MSEELRIKVGVIVDAVNEGVIREIKKLKTSVKNIRTISKLEQECNNEMRLYQTMQNDYIMENGMGEGMEKRIDVNDPIQKQAYLNFLMGARENNSDITKFSKPLFTIDELDEKGFEMSTTEAQILGDIGVIEDLGLSDLVKEEPIILASSAEDEEAEDLIDDREIHGGGPA
jgi:hypothetical protein